MPKYEDDLNVKDDAEDNKFYKQPMSIDKRAAFMSYNRRGNIQCPRPLPVCSSKEDIRKGNDAKKAINLMLKVLNTTLLGQSIIAWGYLQIYFLNENLYYSNSNKFEIKLLKMRKTLLTLLDMIKNLHNAIKQKLNLKLQYLTW